VNTFRGDRELAALGNVDGLLGLVARVRGRVLDLLDNVVALKDLTEDDVATVEPTNQSSQFLAPTCALQ
jgi:hypothetical protein